MAKSPNPPGPIVNFLGFQCQVERTTYTNGRPALVLVDAKDGEEVTVATVNLPDVPLPPGHAFIKDYSENEGVLAALEEAGIVKATGHTVRTGFVEVPVAELLSPQHGRSAHDDAPDRKESPAGPAVPEPTVDKGAAHTHGPSDGIRGTLARHLNDPKPPRKPRNEPERTR